MIRSLRNNAMALAGIAAVLVAGAACDANKAKDLPPVQTQVDSAPVNRQTQMVTSYSPIVKKVGPSVVNVFSTKKIKVQESPQMPFMNDPFFRHFFGIPEEGEAPRGPRGRGGANPRFREQMGLGSGVIITKDGYILTNNHVVDAADEVKVGLGSGKREYPAQVVGKDPRTDLAVLKIKTTEALPAITLGDSDQIEVGDVALAIGNPFGIGQTVTMGIVSALGRHLPQGGEGADTLANFIQTDAPINPGNSGGALVDASGRLIGINTAILSGNGGGSVGIGFAIPVNLARNVMDQIIKGGKVVRGYLGVNIQAVTPELAQEFGLKDLGGVLVAGVSVGSPAEKAGVKSGDVIVQLNGKDIPDPSELRVAVTQLAPGAKAQLKLIRKGSAQNIDVMVEALPEEQKIAKAQPQENDAQEGAAALAGVSLTELNAEWRKKLSIPSGVQGVVVQDLSQDSLGAQAGLRPGDLIQEVNHVPVKTVRDAGRAAEAAQGKNLLLLVWNAGGSRFVILKK